MVLKNISLNAWSKNENLPPIVVAQGDAESNTIEITLIDDNGQPINLTNITPRVHFTKPDDTIAYIQSEVTDPIGGKCRVTLTSQVAAIAGTVSVTVHLVDADEATLYIKGLKLYISPNDIDGSVESANDFSALTEALSTVQQYDGRIADLETGKADKSDLVNVIYPVGAIYISVSSTNPSTFLGGTWERFARGQTLIGVDASDTDFNAAGKTGGSKTHKLTVSEMPSHKHLIRVKDEAAGGTAIGSPRPYGEAGGATNRQTETVGGNQPHNNMPPYITVYMWQRTA